MTEKNACTHSFPSGRPMPDQSERPPRNAKYALPHQKMNFTEMNI